MQVRAPACTITVVTTITLIDLDDENAPDDPLVYVPRDAGGPIARPLAESRDLVYKDALFALEHLDYGALGTAGNPRLALVLGGGSEWESNPPSPSKITIYGFEDRESHRTPCASEKPLSEKQ